MTTQLHTYILLPAHILIHSLSVIFAIAALYTAIANLYFNAILLAVSLIDIALLV